MFFSSLFVVIPECVATNLEFNKVFSEFILASKVGISILT